MKTILDYLIENKSKPIISFRGPGHKGRMDIFEQSGYGDFYSDMLKEDITAIPGKDALAGPEGLIRSTMGYYADLYGVQDSYLLTGGCGSGVITTILSCVAPGGKLILGRNSSDAAFEAMRVSGIRPIYMRPELSSETGLEQGITAAEVRMACEDNPDAGAVLITSPNYYGMVSDIAAIADVVHHCGMKLIVDQTNGSHLLFFDAVSGTSTAAENLGADIVINSACNSLLGIAGTGFINVCSNRVDTSSLEDALHSVQAEGSSYLAFGSLDVNEKILRRQGGVIVKSWMDDLVYVYHQLNAISGVKIITSNKLDPTHISVSLAELGVSTDDFVCELRAAHIKHELVHGDYVLFNTGAGNRRSDYDALIKVVRELSQSYGVGNVGSTSPAGNNNFALACTDIPTTKVAMPLYRADGRAIYNPITTYPPGSPIICPGEIISLDVISYVAKALARGDKVIGVDEEGYVFVGD